MLFYLVSCQRIAPAKVGRELRKGTSQVAPVLKNLPASAGDEEIQGQSLGQEDPLALCCLLLLLPSIFPSIRVFFQ